jgi:hypothetical protein
MIKSQCDVTAPVNSIGGVDNINSEGLYLIKLNNACSELDKKYNLRFPSTLHNCPLPGKN